MYEKLKSLAKNDGLYTTLLLLLVGIVSFGLGRESVHTTDSSNRAAAGVMFIEAPAQEYIPTTPTITPNTETSTRVVASRSGTKYHLLDCPGAKQIKEENKLFFDTIELARAAGYTPAANCAGLE